MSRAGVLAVAVLCVGAAAAGPAAASPYTDLVLGKSPQAYYRLGDAPNSLTAKDSSGRGYTGTYQTGTRGLAGALTEPDTATGGGAGAEMTASVPGPQVQTLEFWAINFSGSWGVPYDHIAHGTPADGWSLKVGQEDFREQQLYFVLEYRNKQIVFDDYCIPWSINTWDHYVFVWDSTSISCYVNGNRQITLPLDGTAPLSPQVSTNFVVSSASERLDEVALYNRKLDAAEIAAHYHAGLRPYITSAPYITGPLYEGEQVRTTLGSWNGQDIAYTRAWYRCTGTTSSSCTAIPGASDATYTVQSEDVGKRLQTRITAENAHGVAIAVSAITGVVGPLSDAPNPYSDAVGKDEPLLYYRFTELPLATKARNWASSGSALDGTFASGERGVPGPLNLADKAVARPSLTASAPLVENGLEFFARSALSRELGDQVYMSHGNVSGISPVDGWVLYVSGTDHMLHFAYRFAIPGSLDVPAADVALPCAAPSLDLAWTHYVITWSKVVDGHRVATCYADGDAAADVDLIGNWSIPAALYEGRELKIGSPATIDEFATYRDLNATQVADHHRAAVAARGEVTTPAIAGTVTDATGGPARGVVAILISPFEAMAEDTADGTDVTLEVLGAADLDPTGAYSIVPKVTDTVRRAAELNNGVVNLTWVARGRGYSIMRGVPMDLVGDQLHSKDAGATVGSSSTTMNASTQDDSPGLVLYEGHSDTEGGDISADDFQSAQTVCRSNQVGLSRAYVKTGETHSWAGQGVRFGYAQDRQEESTIGVAIKSGDAWRLAGSVSRSRSVSGGWDSYKPEYNATRFSNEWQFQKLRWWGGCGYYDSIRAVKWTGGAYPYGIDRGWDGNCRNNRYRSYIGQGIRHWYRRRNRAHTYSVAAEVFGVNVFNARSGYSTNVEITYTLSQDRGHYLCGDGDYPTDSGIIYAG